MKPHSALPVDPHLLDLLGDRWSLWLVVALSEREGARFSDLAREPGLSRRVLAERLERLRRAGLVETRPYSSRPVRHHYLLTARGGRVRRMGLAMLHVAGGGALDERSFVRSEAAVAARDTLAATPTPAPLPDIPARDQPDQDAHPTDRLLGSDQQYAWSIYHDTVAALVRYDEQYRTQLVETLEIYLECDASISVTAARLYAHRHTIRYRLGRIRELTSLDVDSLTDRERLVLGLRAMWMFRRQGRELA